MTKQIAISFDEKMERVKQKLSAIEDAQQHIKNLKHIIHVLQSEKLVSPEFEIKEGVCYYQTLVSLRFLKPHLKAIEKSVQDEIDEDQKKLDDLFKTSILEILVNDTP